MPITKEPLIVNCFKCQKDFKVKWVISRQNYSQKNNWDYWTEKEENKDKKICNQCLVELNEKDWESYRELFSSQKKAIFKVYKSSGKFA